ncbi:hypothetical protein THMIRHAS_05590 [Thiosulfatimonas sediminis]|uniref:Nickel/cobalt efflux system n=1 Tax=Thiosulfatimonas sediminis TaxID=2675054 RepID=A0A6F8PSX2_9GAMM|nr:hypothetical protein [Thiosulfatimonas sediminis]BBP45186.1 hypothetical protein THMIRHAS_05590 [Thiosulfatimonas sediminis]
MLEAGFVIVFFYGMLHAFGPDHLTAIADFSIGRERARVFKVALGFAIGHGVSLYLFALLLQQFNLSEALLAWGDIAAVSLLIVMGAYLLYLVAADRIHVGQHAHNGHEHIHVWYGKSHEHARQSGATTKKGWIAAATLGVLMGIGGARGMLVSLAALSEQAVTPMMIVSFTLGVAIIFVVFGFALMLVNKRLMQSQKLLRGGYAVMGATSMGVGSFLLLS